MKEVYEKLKITLGTNLEGTPTLSREDALEFTPVGWRPFFRYFNRLLDIVPGIYMQRVKLHNGILRVNFWVDDKLDYHIVKWVQNRIAYLSAMQCMVCGEKGIRRKRELPMVTMCGPHYLEYINFLDGVDFTYKKEDDIKASTELPRTQAWTLKQKQKRESKEQCQKPLS